MAERFKNVPKDNDTKILFETEVSLGEYSVRYEKWYSEGVWAESIIFANEDVENLTQTDVENMLKSLPLFKNESRITYKKSDSGFTFVNFNFETNYI